MLKLLYRVLWVLGRPLAVFATGGGKVAQAVRGRLHAAETLAAWALLHRDTARPLVWFHAASVGEGRQAEAVMRRLRAGHPDWQIVFTHSSSSATRLAAAVPADFAGYLPADTVSDVRRALRAVRPSLLVFSATDLWPELIAQAKAQGVPVALTSATLAPTSSRRGWFARALLHDAWRSLDAVGAIGERDAEAVASLGVPRARIVVTGDTRHDSAAARAAAVDRTSSILRALGEPGPPVVVAGSTWPGDEKALIESLAMPGAPRPLRLVIAAHEPAPAHLAAIESEIEAQLPGVPHVRLADFSAWPAGDLAICLVDRVGLLADLYAVASVAYVGGGFHGAGLHAVIEPAALGVPVLFGPRWQSSNDAALLLETGGARAVGDTVEICAVLREWLGDEDARSRAGQAARGVVDRGVGAAERSVAMLLRLMKDRGG